MNARNAMRARTMFPHGGACIHVPWPWPRYVKDERYMRPQTPILYKRVILYTHFRSRPVRGAGGVLASDFYRQILSSTWASVVPAGTVPKDTAHHCVGRDTAPGISLLMEWWTIHHRGALQSLARDARRSHRSVEGDDLSNVRERERQTATKPRYYIRGIEITAQTGLGRFGGAGGPRQRLRAPSSCRPHGPRSCQMARYPRTTPPFRRPLRPSCDAVFAPIPTKSGASRASGWILGSWERRRPGPASAASRSLQKIVGAIVGAAYRVGHEHLRGSSPPRVHLKPDSGRPRRSGPAPIRASEGLRA